MFTIQFIGNYMTEIMHYPVVVVGERRGSGVEDMNELLEEPSNGGLIKKKTLYKIEKECVRCYPVFVDWHDVDLGIIKKNKTLMTI